MEPGKALPHTIRAFMLAPLVPVPLAGIVLFIQGQVTNSMAVFSIEKFVMGLGLFMIVGSLLFAYPVALLLFMPQHFLLTRQHLTSYRYYALIGLTSGLLASALFFLIQSQTTIPSSLTDYSLLTGSSLVAALAFRYIAGYTKKSSNKSGQTNA